MGLQIWYQGGYRSVMEFSGDRPVDLLNIFDPLNFKTDDVDLSVLIKATMRNSLDQISSAMVQLLHNGKTEKEIVSTV